MLCSAVPSVHCLAVCAALIITVVISAMVGPTSGQPAPPNTSDRQSYGQILRRFRSMKSQKHCFNHIVNILSMLCDGNLGAIDWNDESKQNQLKNSFVKSCSLSTLSQYCQPRISWPHSPPLPQSPAYPPPAYTQSPPVFSEDRDAIFGLRLPMFKPPENYGQYV